MTVPEVRRLLWQLLRPPLVDDAFVWAWSHWRRHHQAVAMRCHDQRRLACRAA